MTDYWTPEIGQQVWMNYPEGVAPASDPGVKSGD